MPDFLLLCTACAAATFKKRIPTTSTPEKFASQLKLLFATSTCERIATVICAPTLCGYKNFSTAALALWYTKHNCALIHCLEPPRHPCAHWLLVPRRHSSPLPPARGGLHSSQATTWVRRGAGHWRPRSKKTRPSARWTCVVCFPSPCQGEGLSVALALHFFFCLSLQPRLMQQAPQSKLPS